MGGWCSGVLGCGCVGGAVVSVGGVGLEVVGGGTMVGVFTFLTRLRVPLFSSS